MSNGKTTALKAGLLGAVIALGGCMNTISGMAVPMQEPLYRKTLSVPDSGQRIDATSGAALSYSLNAMTRGLKPAERNRVVRAATGLAVYQGCLDYGRYTIADNTGLGRPHIRPQDCSKKAGRFSDGVAGIMTGFEKHGRPDVNVFRDATVLGDVKRRTRGWSSDQSWARFHQFGAHSLNGLTRTQMMNRYADLVAGF